MAFDFIIDEIASKALENNGTPDVLVVFRAVPEQHQNDILRALYGQLSESFQTSSEKICSLKSSEVTFDALQHMGTIKSYYGLSMAFKGDRADKFRLYIPRDGGLPLTAKHILVVEGPK